MSTADLSGYVDLTIYDKDTQDIFDLAQAIILDNMPDWVPREGNTEVLLLEAMAAQVMEVVYAINRLPGAVVQVLLQLYGITRDNGAPPTVDLKFTLSDTYGHDIPAGTRVLMTPASGADAVVFSTDVAVTVPNGSTIVTVASTGDRYTEDVNGVAVGTTVELLDAIPYVNSVVTDTAVVTGGRNPEDDGAWLDRGTSRLARLSEALVIPSQFALKATEYAFVSRATAINLLNPGVSSSAAGHVSVAVYGVGGMVSSTDKTTLLNDIQALASAQLVVHIIDATLNTVDVTVTVKANPQYTNAEVTTAITNMLGAYLSPESWDFSTTLYWDDLASRISALDEVYRLTSLTTPAGDVTLTGDGPLTQLGTVTVNFS